MQIPKKINYNNNAPPGSEWSVNFSFHTKSVQKPDRTPQSRQSHNLQFINHIILFHDLNTAAANVFVI